eukprot:8727218-Pyramimonas_sp.AAC.1
MCIRDRGEDDEPGTGALMLAGSEWAMLDYRDKLALDPETVEVLGLLGGPLERRDAGQFRALLREGGGRRG